jgi:opacity protein-like surface antigen
MRTVLLVLVEMLMLPVAIPAQTGASDRRAEVFGIVASETLTDDESSLGTSLMAGAGVRYRLSERFDVEGRGERISHERNFDSGVRFSATGGRVVGRLLYHFSPSDGKVRPYVSGSAGYMSLTRSSAFPIVSPGPGFGRPIVTGHDTFERSLNESLWGGGGGVDLRLTDRWSVRPEANLLWSLPSNYVGFQFGAALGVRW